MGTVDKCFFLFFKCKLFERHTKKINTYVAADDADANVVDNANGGADDAAADIYIMMKCLCVCHEK